MPPAPSLAACSEAATAPSTIWYRVCTKHGTRSGNLSSGRSITRLGTRRGTRFRTSSCQFGTGCGTSLMLDLVANRVFDLGPNAEWCHRSGARFDLGTRSVTRFRIESVTNLGTDQKGDLLAYFALDYVPEVVPGLVCQY